VKLHYLSLKSSWSDTVNQRFLDNVVLVAGGTGGLGAAVSLAFLKEGAKVLVTYRRKEEFASLQLSAGTTGGSLTGVEADVTDEIAVKSVIERIVQDHTGLDCLVNTVGAYAGGTRLWELDNGDWDRLFALNLRSNYLLCRAVVPEMLKIGRGAILNVVARAAFDHAAGASAYAASKAAALAMTDSLAEDLKGTGVRANSILPSIIDTEANRKEMPGADFGKWPKPDDIARVILFLCSDDAKVVHGAAVPVYGDR
jgi:NAD(P)-dependent dehydrogenase (short-subunit alcohol dehydrogenase family)